MEGVGKRTLEVQAPECRLDSNGKKLRGEKIWWVAGRLEVLAQ